MGVLALRFDHHSDAGEDSETLSQGKCGFRRQVFLDHCRCEWIVRLSALLEGANNLARWDSRKLLQVDRYFGLAALRQIGSDNRRGEPGPVLHQRNAGTVEDQASRWR